MDVRLLVLWIIHFSASSASGRMRKMKGSRGQFCVGAFYASYGYGVSALGCARACSSDNSCVAYSLLLADAQCLLHDQLCADTALVPAPAALYAGERTAEWCRE
jgi:hypothetical protein